MYMRVLPRDAFNEANLLKCYGQLYLQLEFHDIPGVELVHFAEDEPFRVYQNPGDGSLMLDNVQLLVRADRQVLFRPLNSREPYPLYCITRDDCIAVFNDDGTLTIAMLDFLKG